METRANYAVIGFFTLVVIALALGFVYWLKRLDETGVRVPMFIQFTGSVSGLEAGGSVYFNGLKVGEVVRLTFNPTDPNKITVETSVRGDTPIKTDTFAKISASLLTGVAYIEMSGGTPQAQSVFAQNPPLLISQATGGDIVAALNQISTKIDRVVDRIDSFVAQNQPALTESISNIKDFTEALSKNSAGVGDFLKNVSDMAQTVKSLSGQLTALVDKADKVAAAIDPEKVKSVIDNADVFVKRVTDASSDIPGVVADVKQVASDAKQIAANVKETVGAFDKTKITSAIDNITGFTDRLKTNGPDFDQIVANAKAAVANANEFVDNLNKHNGDVDQIVADAKDLAAQLKKSSQQLDTILGKANDMLGTEGGKNFFAEASAAAHSIKEVADKFNARADDIADGLAKFSGRGLNDVETLVEQMRGSVARIDRAVSDFSANPSSIVFGGTSGIRDYNRK